MSSYCTHCGAELSDDASSCPACRRPLAAWPTTPPPPPFGAPAGPGATAKRTSPGRRVAVGLGCVGLLVVAGGIVAALLVPRFTESLDGAKQARTLADLRGVGTALEHYRAENVGVPVVGSFGELAALLTPEPLASLPGTDGWGHPLRYECTAAGGPTGCTRYRIASPGRDGAYALPSLADYLPEAFGSGAYDRDLVYGDGLFVQSPEGP